MAIPISQRIPNNEQELYRQMFDAFSRQLRVACPGIIQEFDATNQTATVQCSIQERVQNPETLEFKWMTLPLLLDVPVYFPRAGGFSITFPVQKGDECLVVFADMAIDGFWLTGNVSPQVETRRHDLSDGFAFIGFTSVPKSLQNVSETSMRIQTDDGSTYIDITKGTINLVATNVQKNGVNI